MKRQVLATLLAVLSLAGCSDSPQDPAEIELIASGTPVENLDLDEGFSLTLTRADLAFGPLYICPGSQAGELCDTARLSWTESAVVQALREESQELGLLQGITGPARSWMFDYGISSLLTQEEPVPLEAAKELGGTSLQLEGTALLDETEIPFSLEVIVQQGEGTERGIPVVRKSSSDAFDIEVTTSTISLTVEFDPTTWFIGLRRSDFEEALTDCNVGVDASCKSLHFDADSHAARAVGLALVVGERPKFTLK